MNNEQGVAQREGRLVIVAARLGTDGFGLWALLQATVGLFGLFDLGFGVSVVKYIAEARGRKDPEHLSALTATFFWVYTALGTAVMLAAGAFAFVLPSALNIPGEHAAAARTVFMLIAFRTALGMPLGMFAGVMTGFQRQWWANIFKTAGTLLYAAGAAWALLTQPSVEWLAAASLAAHTLAMAAGAWLCLSQLPGVDIRPCRFRLGLVREVSSFSMYFFIVQVSTLIYTCVDTLIVQSFLSLSAVALYSVAVRIAEEASSLCRQLTNALTPVVAELQGAGEEQNIREVFRLGTKLSTALAAPLLAGLFLYAEPLLVAWMGQDFRPAAPVCQVLLAAMMISVVHGNAANILSMTGRQRFLAFSFLGGQVLNLTLTIIFVQKFGLVGVALATLLSSAVVDIGLVQPCASRYAGLPQIRFYFSTVAPSVIPLILMYGALWSAGFFLPTTSLWTIALLEAYGCAVFFLAFFFIGLTRDERAYLLSRVKPATTPPCSRPDSESRKQSRRAGKHQD